MGTPTHLARVVPQVRLEAPQADLQGRKPRAAGGYVAPVVRVGISCVVDRADELGPGQAGSRRGARPVTALCIVHRPVKQRDGLRPAHN